MVGIIAIMLHPDFELPGTSWELALRADGYADNSVRAYQNAVRSLAAWRGRSHDGIGPADLTRDHIRGWLVYVRETHSASTARGWFAGVRHFCRLLVAEGEAARDATEGVKTPAPGEPQTPVLSAEQLRALLATCAGGDLIARRDTAIILPRCAVGYQGGPCAGPLPAGAAPASVRERGAAVARRPGSADAGRRRDRADAQAPWGAGRGSMGCTRTCCATPGRTPSGRQVAMRAT